MNSNVRNLILFVLTIVVGLWLVRFVLELAVGLFFHILVPAAIVGGVVYAAYLAFGRKALSGGRRTLP